MAKNHLQIRGMQIRYLKLIKSSEVSKRGLDCFFYNIIAESGLNNSILKTCRSQKTGFKVPLSIKQCESIDDAIEFIQLWNKKRFNLPLILTVL